MSLAKLRAQQNRLLTDLVDKANNVDKKSGGGNRVDDDRYWKPVGDTAGNGTFIFRFLPAVEGEDAEYVHYYRYQFKHLPTGRYYNERSLSTLSKPDPVADRKKELRLEGKDEVAKTLRRSDKFIFNIRMIKDSNNPENNGKVFLYETGKQVFDKYKDAMVTDDEVGKVGYDPSDPWTGRNFVLKLIKKGDFPNYEESQFVQSPSVLGTDEEIETIWKSQHSLAAEVAEEKYLSYDVLKEKLDVVMSSPSRAKPNASREDGESVADKNQSKAMGNIDATNVDALDIDAMLSGVNMDDD